MRAVSRAWKAVATSRLKNVCQFDVSGRCQGVSARGFSQLAEKKETSSSSTGFKKLREQLNAKPSESVELVKDWVKQGNEITEVNIREIYDAFCKRRLYREALQVIEFAKDQEVLKPSPETCMLQLKLTCREHGAPSTERLFSKLPPSLKTDDVTATFLDSLTKNKAAYKALKWIDQLKLEPETPSLYAAVVCVYFALNMHERLLSTFTAMKEKGVEPTLYTCLVMLKLRGRLGGLEDLEQEVRQVVNKIEIDNVLTLNYGMEIYARLREAEKVVKIWEVLQGLEDPLHDSYLSALISFGFLGKVDKAEEVCKKMVELKMDRPGSSPYLRMIDVYTKQGMLDKAELMLDQNINEADRNYYPYNCLAAGYLAKGDTETAMQKLVKGYEYGGVRPSYEVVRGLLPVFEEAKDVAGATKMLRFYVGKFLGDVHVYNGMLKVYVAAKKKPAELLKKFNVVANEETEELRKKASA